MHVVIHPSGHSIVQLAGSQLQRFSAAQALVATLDLQSPQRLAACETCVAVLTGELAPAGASLSGAVVHRYAWDLTPLGEIEVGEVDRNGLSLSADGSRIVVTDWRTCEVTVYDALTGAKIGGAGQSIPSGASLSPDGNVAIAGAADQGDGAILHFEVDQADGRLRMTELPPPKSRIGLDDAPYVSAFAPDAKRAALSNESWGGRGLFVYDMEAREPLWCAEFGSTSDEPEAWSPPPLVFARGGRLLLVRCGDVIQGYRAADGERLSHLVVEGVEAGGFAADDHGQRVIVAGAQPVAYAFPDDWLTS